MIHFHCLLLATIVLIYAFSVCKILLHKKLGRVIFFDKFQVCWGSEVLSSGRDHLLDFNINVDFEFGCISSPKSRNRWTVNTPGRAILIWGGEPKWEAAPSNRFKNLSSFASLPPKVVSLSISVMWAVLVLDGYQKILAVLFLCVKKKKDAPVLFPSYFEGTRPNKSQWMRSQRGQLIDIVMHKCWFIPQNSQKENKGISKAQYKMKTDLLTPY